MDIAALWFWGADELKTAGVDNPRFTAELLLRDAMGWSRAQLLTRGEFAVPIECEERYREFIRQRSLGIATQYIRGKQEFYGRIFYVTPDVLIPRPETEVLVETVLSYLHGAQSEQRILDLCTGSGCIGLTLALELPLSCVTLADISAPALAVAGGNAERLAVSERVELSLGDLFVPLKGRRFSCIVSNPPYIPDGELDCLSVEVRGEPRSALAGGEDGLYFYRRIIEQVPHHLDPKGMIALEIGHGQAKQVEDLLAAAGFSGIELALDLAGKERVLSAILA